MNRLPIIFFLSILIMVMGCKETAENETDNLSVSEVYYQEPHRPQIHFSPEQHWMNDPNGMVYYDGEYHLFYQYYPDGTVWGPMHWGHAVSTDMVHWEHLPIALYPDELGYIFSGSAVVDENNTSGLAPEGQEAIVAIYTYHDTVGEKAGEIDFQTQGIAYSLDKGRTWEKYANNPVIDNPGIRDFRDPKVFWHDASESWVMILAVKDHVNIYRSPNLIEWTLASEFGIDQGSHGGVWECPDLFELPVNGQEGTSKWLMIVSLGDGAPNGGSGTQYFIGDFDGTTFTNDNPSDHVMWMDYGRDNYAGVTFANIPEEDSRRIFIGWMSNWKYATVVPTDPWRSAMTLARTLELEETSEGLRLMTKPVKEISSLRQAEQPIPAQVLTEEVSIANISAPYELELSFDLEESDENEFGIVLSNSMNESVRIGYHPSEKEFYVDRRASGNMEFSEDFPGKHTAPHVGDEQKIDLRIFVDVASIEIYAQGGRVVLSENFFPTEVFSELSLFSKGEGVKLSEGVYYLLSSIWEKSTSI